MFNDKKLIQEAFIDKLNTMLGKSLSDATLYDKYVALSYVVRDKISRNWLETNQRYKQENGKQVYYFSMEFLLGSLLDCNLINIGNRELVAQALAELDINLDELTAQEHDAGLGNGGLGRLAACFLDSMSSLGIHGHGCGIRYKYGLFEQRIVDGNQVELPDDWIKDDYIWEYRRADKAVDVNIGGRIQEEFQPDGSLKIMHTGYTTVRAVPYDIPIVGYQNGVVNTLRLWSAELINLNFNMRSMARTDYLKALEAKHYVESISRLLYPDDSVYEGRLLRLSQQYFFVSAGLQSILNYQGRRGNSLKDLAKYVAIHINDTHPTLAIPELMRLLMDEHNMSWDEAWKITVETISYTNHTILPEALETWPIDMMQKTLPRLFSIIQEIDRRNREQVFAACHDWWPVHAMTILQDGLVHMARLAVVGSHSINGVAKLHSNILRTHVMREFDRYFVGRFNNKTNGITHRRWIIKANPALSALLDYHISPSWRKHPQELIKFLEFADNPQVQQEVEQIKFDNKVRLAEFVAKKYCIELDPNSIFDIQIKRIHSYKRQLMNILHIMYLYNKLIENPELDMVPRTFIFAGKAAPGYYIAKQTIKLINTLAEKINSDARINNKIKVVFLENYSVSLGEILFPAADISEQISTASKEASGTGNMKFMLNGAITLGTLDGANVEIHEQVGDDNIVIFGMTAEEVLEHYRRGDYNAWEMYNTNPDLKKVLDQLIDGTFGRIDEFRSLYDYLLVHNDEFFVLKDFDAYTKAHLAIEAKYRNRRAWLHSCIVNIAHSGIFASDRTIREYADDIWHVPVSD